MELLSSQVFVKLLAVTFEFVLRALAKRTLSVLLLSCSEGWLLTLLQPTRPFRSIPLICPASLTHEAAALAGTFLFFSLFTSKIPSVECHFDCCYLNSAFQGVSGRL